MLLTTLERYKSKYEITDNALDNQITMEIEQVSAEIETTCNRTFDETDYEVVMYGSGTNELVLNEYPIKTATVADYTDFVINKKAGILQSGSIWSATTKYTISFTAGYATIPADLEKACMVMVSMALERRGSEHLKTEVIGPLRNDFATNVPDILEKYRKIAI
jgi:hypothetical protein